MKQETEGLKTWQLVIIVFVVLAVLSGLSSCVTDTEEGQKIIRIEKLGNGKCVYGSYGYDPFIAPCGVYQIGDSVHFSKVDTAIKH